MTGRIYRIEIFPDGQDWVGELSINGEEMVVVTEHHLDTLLADMSDLILDDDESKDDDFDLLDQ